MGEPGDNAKAEFFKALIKAKAGFKPLTKNKVNPHFKSEYADLAQLHASVDAALSANGFVVIAPIIDDEKGQAVHTRLVHTGGHEELSVFRLPAGMKAQDMGSWVTYGNRYGLQSLLGIAPSDGEDDDGNAAQASEAAPAAKAPPKPAKAVQTGVKTTNGTDGLASGQIANIAKSDTPVPHNAIRLLNGEEFLLPDGKSDEDKRKALEILKVGQVSMLKKSNVVVEFHLSPKGAQIVDAIKVEG